MTVTSRAGAAALTMPDGARAQLLEGTWNALQGLLSARDQIRATAESIPYVRGFE